MLLKNKNISFKFLSLCISFICIFASANGANEVHKAIFHSYKDSNYVILHLYNFRPLGGSYEKGNERVSGYNESEILIYNLDSRKLVAQKDFGLNNDISALEILGCSDSILWIYSMHYKSGLQGLNIYSLERKISQAQIYNRLSVWQGRFYDTKWNEINEYFGFNYISNSLIVTNYLKKQFLINTKSFEIEFINPPVLANRKKSDYQSKVIYSDKDTLNIFNGLIHKNKVEYLPNNPFFEGSFIAEQNVQKQYTYFNELLLFFKNVLKNSSSMLARVKASKDSEAYEELYNNKLWYEQKVAETKENIDALIMNKKADKLLLSSDNNSFFILHRNNQSNDSFVTITKLSNGANKFEVNWETTIPGMFFNIQTARDTKLFKRYFGDFMPENNKIYIEEINDALIIINQMQVCSINSKTGEINWQFKL